MTFSRRNGSASLKIFLRLLCFALLCAALAHAGSVALATEAKDNMIKIGVYLPLNGTNAFAGGLELDGILLAHKEASKVLGKKVQLVIEDNKSDRDGAEQAMQSLVRQKVVAVLGTYGSSLAIAGGKVAEEARMPVLGSTCTNPLVTRDRRYYFRTCFTDPHQGRIAAEYAAKHLKARTAAVILEATEEYSVGLANYFEKYFAQNGGKIVAREVYEEGRTDFQTQLANILAKNPDVLYLPAHFTEGALIVKQARAMNARFAILGGDAMDNPQIASIGPAMEGFAFTTFAYDPNMPKMGKTAREFTAKWKKEYPGKTPNSTAASGYDSYRVLVDAIRRANSTKAGNIVKALGATKNFPGATGTITINKSHDNEGALGIVQVKNGKRVFLTLVNPTP